MNKDIIGRLKANKEAFGLMEPDERDKLWAVAANEGVNNIMWYAGEGDVPWETIANNNFRSRTTYRLSPSYSPEPEVVEQTWEDPEIDPNAAIIQLQEICTVLIDVANKKK